MKTRLWPPTATLMGRTETKMVAGLRFQGQSKDVLITGCSSEIGRATALYLAQHGFTVYATVRKEADADSLRALDEPGLVPVCLLDLTRLEQISRVVETVEADLARRGRNGLGALVNVAVGHMAGAAALLESLPQTLADAILKARFRTRPG